MKHRERLWPGGVFLLVLFTVPSLFFVLPEGWGLFRGFLCGGLIGGWNAMLIVRTHSRALRLQPGSAGRYVILWFLFRQGCIFLFLYLVLRWEGVHLAGAASGLAVSQITLGLYACFQ